MKSPSTSETHRVATLSFQAVPPMVRFARSVVGALLEGHPRQDDAVSVVSELVTNSINHSRSRTYGLVHVNVDVAPTVRLEVIDEGPATRALRAVDPGLAEDGRGLEIVDRLATKWNREIEFDRGVSWAELE